MLRISRLFFLGILVFALTACQSETTEKGPPTGSEPTTNPTNVPQSTPTTEQGTATLEGILYQKTTEGQKPYAGMKVFLGVLLKDTSGEKEVVARINQPTAPQGITDENGHFMIFNIPPGRYILAVLVPPQSILGLLHPDTGEDFIIELAAGQALNLGNLEYDFEYPVYDSTPPAYPLPEPQPTTAYPAP